MALVNKPINLFYFLHIYTYKNFCFLFFYCFGLGPASPARSLAEASDPAGQNVDQACIHCAKVIKLPSHSVLWSFNFKERKGMKSWRTCFWSGEDGCNAGGDFRSTAFLYLPAVSTVLSSSQFLRWTNRIINL
jgi:hypothetical protein